MAKRRLPLDYPVSTRPHRVYITLTNSCNRSCPWCATYSSTKGNTWLSIAKLIPALPKEQIFEAQLEGGEPTIHPEFWDFIDFFKAHNLCKKIILCTNGVILPKQYTKLKSWVKKLGENLTIKLSFNHYLLETSTDDMISFAQNLEQVVRDLGGNRMFILNVRIRKNICNNDQHIVDLVNNAGLKEYANIFFLQRYGLASNHEDWEKPFLVAQNFSTINPDGKCFGPNLLARSEAMKTLP